MAKKHVVPDLTPGPLPGTPVTWRCWQIAGHMERRRLRGPREVVARTNILARHAAALDHFDSCDPLCVEAELVEKKLTNGKA
jgi:hypothetical protein